VNRSLRRLYLAMAGAFGLLILFLGYWQVVAAGSLEKRRGNPFVAEREQRVDRGRIISVDGKALAISVPARQNGQRVYLRRYPQGSLAPHVVGYATVEQGKTGIESTFNRYLAGSYGTQPLLQRLNLASKQGADVQLTLDSRVQRTADEALSGKTGAVVALRPGTGEILALASAPTFNLNRVATHFSEIARRNDGPFFSRATQGREPPGSTFKLVTASAALQSGRYTPGSRFDDTGSFVVNGRPITNFGGARYGPHDLTTALTKSINTTFAKIGADLGAATLGAKMSAYGIGARSPLRDLPPNQVATSGRLDGGRVLPNDERGEDAARIAIGQERLAVTPLQMAMIGAAIADGGRVHRPYLVRRVIDRGGAVVREGRPEILGQAVPEEVAAELATMMRSVVREGTGTAAALSGLEVAGKTGTAETGQAGRNQAWFVGFAPADDPKVAVAVLVENTSGTGGHEAAPIAAKVMKAAIDAGGR
jgi:penicillin-binding protein A